MFDPEIDQTTEQESEKNQVREFLSRAEIRTMRKDLQKLREAVALQERERIIGLRPQTAGGTQAPQTAQQRAGNVSRGTAMGDIKIFQQKETEEKEAMVDLKNYAQESEKQQMLYLEEQKMDLQKELGILEKQKEPPLLLEKNKAALKRDEIQKRLKVFLDEEKKIEDEEKLISEREKAVTLPADKENLEKKRWDIEEKRQGAEKRSWAIERELENTEKELKTTDDECQKVVKEINETKNKIAGIDQTLRSVYGEIMTREKARIAKEKEKKDAESLKQAAVASRAKQTVREEQWTTKKGVSDLSFLSKLPEGAKKERLREMMQGTADEEEEQRKKFLENVEKWSEERKSNPAKPPGIQGPVNPQ